MAATAESIRQIEKLGGSVELYGDAHIKTLKAPKQWKGAIYAIHLERANLEQVDVSTVIPLQTVATCSFRGSTVTDQHVEVLRHCQRLELLLLESTSVTDEALKAISEVPTLTMLHLDRCNISDEGLKHLEKCAALKTLTLTDTRVTKEGVDKLKEKLPNLDRIHWSTVPSGEVRRSLVELERHGASVLGASEARIANGPNDNSSRYSLSFGEYWNGCEQQECRQWLQSLSNSERISISIHRRFPEVLESVGTLEQMHKLFIGAEVQLTDEDLKTLLRDVQVKEISLQAPRLTDWGVKVLAHVRGLTHLTLKDVALTSRGVEHLAEAKTLQSLALDDPHAENNVISELKQISSLKRVDIRKCRNISERVIQSLRSQGIEVEDR